MNIVMINISGREFKIKCPRDKIAELQKAAKYLNEKMQETQHGDRSITIDRVAITAALNITHELILEKQLIKKDFGDHNELNGRLLGLQRKLDLALASTN